MMFETCFMASCHEMHELYKYLLYIIGLPLKSIIPSFPIPSTDKGISWMKEPIHAQPDSDKNAVNLPLCRTSCASPCRTPFFTKFSYPSVKMGVLINQLYFLLFLILLCCSILRTQLQNLWEHFIHLSLFLLLNIGACRSTCMEPLRIFAPIP